MSVKCTVQKSIQGTHRVELSDSEPWRVRLADQVRIKFNADFLGSSDTLQALPVRLCAARAGHGIVLICDPEDTLRTGFARLAEDHLAIVEYAGKPFRPALSAAKEVFQVGRVVLALCRQKNREGCD